MTVPVPARVVPAVIATGIRAYTKLLVGVLFALGATIATLVDSGGTAVQWLQVLAQAAVLVTAYVASNTVPGARYAKGIATGVGAALSVLIPALLEGGSGFTGGTLVNMVLAVVATGVVVAVPDLTPSGQNVLRVAATRLDSSRGEHYLTGHGDGLTIADEEAGRHDPA